MSEICLHDHNRDTFEEPLPDWDEIPVGWHEHIRTIMRQNRRSWDHSRTSGVFEPVNAVIKGHKRTTYCCRYMCGTLLYEEEIDLNGKRTKYRIHDDVYERYYTRKGRHAWLIRLLKAADTPIPSIWEEE